MPFLVRVIGEGSEELVHTSGTDEDIRRLVETYSPMLLRLAAARLASLLPMRRMPYRRPFCGC